LKRSALFAVAAVVFAAACQDAVTSTSPQLSGDLAFSITGNPPPPPIDTGARGRFLPDPALRADPTSHFLQPRFSIVQSASPQPRGTILGLPGALRNEVIIDAFDFFLPVQYDLDKKVVNGHVIFKTIKHSKAVLKACHVDLHHGTELEGHGTLTVQTEQGLLVVDCASIEQPPTSWMEPCGDGSPGQRCFHLVFADATLNGLPGSVEVITSCDETANSEEETSCPDFPSID